MRRIALGLAGAALFGTVWGALAPPQRGADDLPRRALALVHDGRFEAARTVLLPSAEKDAQPATLFLLAFTDYWTLLYDPDDPALRTRFERGIETSVEAAERAGKRGVAGAEVWGGTSRLLLAQFRALEKRPLAAAREAGRAKRILEDASGGADGTEALFGLGTYNYMADRVSAFVKGIRAILFLPGGDRERGLEQLAKAASDSRYFALDARLLLATIHASRKERNFDRATAEMERAITSAPHALVVLHASARLDLSLGRVDRAAERLDLALDRVTREPGVHPAVRATLEYHRARAEWARFRPDRTLERLAPLLAPGPGVPREIREDAASLAAEARAIVDSPVWDAISPVLDPAAEPRAAAERGLRLAEASPSDPVAAFAAGVALLRARDPARAIERLSRADRNPNGLPAGWIGPCRLLAGHAADLRGERERAIDFYRRALDSPPFPARDAAHHGLAVPYRDRS